MKLINVTVLQIISLVLVLTSVGCGVTPSKSTATSTPVPIASSDNTSGNWQGSTTPKAGTKQMGALSGSIDQSGSDTASGQFTTSVLRVTSSCFADTPIPSQGFAQNTTLVLNSFAVDQQYLTLNGTSAQSGTNISGTYTINGGCANGSSGSFDITRYSAFTGNYTAGLANGGQIKLTTTQAPGADGNGDFGLTGTAAFTGFTCFTQGTLLSAGNPHISGASFVLPFTTDERAGSTITLTGTINPDAASTSTFQYVVTGGGCAGSGTGTLVRN